MPRPIDPEMLKQLNRIYLRAIRNGVSVWDALNDAGLLLTPEQDRKTRVAAIQAAINHLDSLPVPILVPGYTKGGVSGGDMRRGMTEQLALYANAIEQGRA